MIDPAKLLTEADGLVQYYGFSWSRGRSRQHKHVIVELAKRHQISQRWVLKCLAVAKRARAASAPPVPQTTAMARAHAAFQRQPIPIGMPKVPPAPVPTSAPLPVNQHESPHVLLRRACLDFLKQSRGASPLAIELTKALLDELPSN